MSAVAATTYVPKPGTVAYRAIAWLEEQPVGTEVTSAKWAEGLGIGTANLIVGVSDAVMHGLLERYTKHGQAKPFFYRLPKGALLRQPHASSPVEKPEVQPPAPRVDMRLAGNPALTEYTEGRGSQHVVKAEAARPDATDRETLADASPRVGAMGAGQAADAAATRLKRPGGPSHWRPDPPPMMTAHPGRSSEGETGTGRSAHESAGPQAAPQEQPVSNREVADSGYAAGRGESSAAAPRRGKPKASSAAAVARTAAKDVKAAYVAAIAERTPPDPQAAPAPAKGQLRFACWDTGEFAFERGDTVVDVFTSDEANRLIAFVLRVTGRAA